jgi:L-threonylcarbamoyladenylate synthase
MALGEDDATRMQRCVERGGVVVFPTDTVYGLGCDPLNEGAVRRLYELKGRPADRPAAVMFFDRESAILALAELRSAERAAIEALLPGPVTLLLPNPRHRFPLACGPAPAVPDVLGLRVPSPTGAVAGLAGISAPVMQSSANLSGEPEARRVADISRELLFGADLVLDGGELPGVASTVLDLSHYAETGSFSVLRSGALATEAIERALGPPSC